MPSNAVTASISYNFTYSDAGYAQGTISLTADAGTYWLYWADDSKALDGYYEIAKLTLSSSGTKTHTMPVRTAVPADATKLIALKSASEPTSKSVSSAAAVYTIPASKRLAKGTSQRNYRFASFSDIHIDGIYKTYKYADIHLRKAFDSAAARDADFIVMSGDYVNNNCDYPGVSDSEWDTYEKILADSDYCNPVYEAVGNHELWQGVTSGTNDFIKATGLGDSVSSASKAYFEKDINGDHFIFMSLEGGFYPDKVEEFSDAQLDWLQGLLEQYSGDGKNIYIIEHSLFYKYGAGDTTTNAKPYYDIPLSDDQASTRRFKGLLQTYKDAIFLSGHTHIAFCEQYNFSDNGGTSAQMIHNSSIGGTRHIVNNALNYDYYEDQTEGYIVDVFDDAIIFNGANLYYNMYDPNCCYIVKPSSKVGTGQTVTPTEATEPTTSGSSGGTPTSYYLKGSFNSWGTGNPFYTTSDSDIITAVLNLSAGTYTFKINTGSTWYGNTGTIEDTTKKTSNGGWIMSTGDGNCTLQASGGTYTFNFTLSSKKLNVLYSGSAKSAARTAAKALAEPNETAASSTLYGDVDGNKSVDVNDATIIQRKRLGLTVPAVADNYDVVADVNNDGDVNLRDATLIQMYVANIVDSFPAGDSLEEDISALLISAKADLSKYYRYSSYDCYQALKKQCRAADSGENVTSAALSQAHEALMSVVDVTNVPSQTSGHTVYFENTNNWSTVYAYVWKGSSEQKKWPGTQLNSIGTNKNGKKIYRFTVPSNYTNIIFTNNSEQTQDIYVYADDICYYLADSASPYYVKAYKFESSYLS